MENEGDRELLDALLELSQQAGRRIWWTFVGTSMSPYIKAGDMVLFQHTLKPTRLGDVVVFRRAGGLIAHRVVLIKKHGNKGVYRTKGDNSFSFDAPITQSAILGSVVSIQKNSRPISLERSHIKFLNLLLAFCSYSIGILYQIRGIWSTSQE
jgi:signal peptidase I